MNPELAKEMIAKILEEQFSVFIDAIQPQDQIAEYVEETIKDPEMIERILNVVELFAAAPAPEDGIHAHVENVAYPSGKDIKIQLSISPSHEKRIQCAGLAGQDVFIIPGNEDNEDRSDDPEDGEQLDIEKYCDDQPETTYPEGEE
jgi:hypothetical protein